MTGFPLFLICVGIPVALALAVSWAADAAHHTHTTEDVTR